MTIWKKLSILFLSILVIFTFSACSEQTVVDNSPDDSTSVKEPSFDQIKDSDAIPKSIANLFEELKQKRGYSLFHVEKNNYILFISLGEKNTEGYDIIDPKIEVEGSKVIVIFEELMPDNMVAQVVTYPFKVFYLNDLEDINLLVKNTAGDTLSLIDPSEQPTEDNKTEESSTNSISAIYIGQIDPHTIELGVNKEVKAFDITEVIDQFNSLEIKELDVISVEYTEAENGQNMVSQISKKQSAPSNLESTIEASYLGRADNHSIEVKVNGELMSLQILKVIDKFEALDLKENDKVLITFEVAEHGVKQVLDMEKLEN